MHAHCHLVRTSQSLHNNLDVLVNVESPSSVIEGDCTVTPKVWFIVKPLASTYPMTMSHVPSNSGLYKRVKTKCNYTCNQLTFQSWCDHIKLCTWCAIPFICPADVHCLTQCTLLVDSCLIQTTLGYKETKKHWQSFHRRKLPFSDMNDQEQQLSKICPSTS